jgi:superoxide dismutase, Fe-Mn family
MKNLSILALVLALGLSACQNKTTEPVTPVAQTDTTFIVEPTPLDTLSGYELFNLPYSWDALEPQLDAQTMALHYEKHTKGYFNKLLSALRGSEWQGKSLEEIFAVAEKAPEAILRNGGQVYNHEIFFNIMSPDSTTRIPSSELTDAINRDFGGMDSLKIRFSDMAKAVFGSGWVFLSVDPKGKLFLSSTSNHMNPTMSTVKPNGTPIMACDVWEHSYYLKFQNRRPDYLEAFWSVINWSEVSRRFQTR